MVRTALLGVDEPHVAEPFPEGVIASDVAAAQAAIRAGEVDRLVVPDLTNLGRNLSDISGAVEVLLGMGAQIHVIRSGVTLGTPDGEPLRAQLAWAADLQHRASRAHVARVGRTEARGGRPSIPVDEARVRALWGAGASQVAIARALGVSRGTVQRRLSALGLKGRAGALETDEL